MASRTESLRIIGLAVALTALALASARAQESAIPGLGDTLPGGDGVTVTAAMKSKQVAAGGSGTLVIRLALAEHHYAYKNMLKVEPGGQWPDGFELAAPSMPTPKRKHDAFFEKVMDIYEAPRVELTCRVSVASSVSPATYDLPVKVSYQTCTSEQCFLPNTVPMTASVTVAAAATTRTPIPKESGGEWAHKSWWAILAIAFLSGLGLWLTPCVYPITPVTIAVIGATEASSRLVAFVRSLMYVLGISLVYSALGVVAAVSGGLFGAWSGSPVLNVALAVLFAVLSLAMFDVYALQLPAGATGKLQSKLRGKGGIIGVFVMGLVSALVLSPCITPVLSTALVYVAKTGNKLFGFLVFFALAWGLGLPLVVLGTFTGLLKSLPKSGEWMVRVKHVFGLVMIGAAVYFLHQAHVVPPAWMLGGVAVLLALLSVLSGGLEPLPAGATLSRRLQKVFGVLCFMVALALVLRLALAGGGAVSPSGGFAALPSAGTEQPAESGIDWQPWSADAVAAAAKAGKPVMIDFTADWCASCVVMARTTFVDLAVVAESRRFVCLRVDMSWKYLKSAPVKAAQAEYGIRGAPILVFYDSKGRRLPSKRIQEKVDAPPLLATLKSID